MQITQYIFSLVAKIFFFFDFIIQADIYPDLNDLSTIFFINLYHLLDTKIIKLNFREFSRVRDSATYPSVKSMQTGLWR